MEGSVTPQKSICAKIWKGHKLLLGDTWPLLSGTYATPGPHLESSQTILQEPRKEYSPTRGLGSDLISLVAFLGDALGVVGIKKKNFFGDSMTKILVTT